MIQLLHQLEGLQLRLLYIAHCTLHKGQFSLPTRALPCLMYKYQNRLVHRDVTVRALKALLHAANACFLRTESTDSKLNQCPRREQVAKHHNTWLQRACQ